MPVVLLLNMYVVYLLPCLTSVCSPEESMRRKDGDRRLKEKGQSISSYLALRSITLPLSTAKLTCEPALDQWFPTFSLYTLPCLTITLSLPAFLSAVFLLVPCCELQIDYFFPLACRLGISIVHQVQFYRNRTVQHKQQKACF